MAIDQEIAKLLHRLPEAQHQRVLDFARELVEVTDAIEEGCEVMSLAE